MALQKEIINTNGAIASYHRISNISKNYNMVILNVESYHDSTYRKLEKELIQLNDEQNSLISRLSILTGLASTDETETEIQEITNKLNRLKELTQIGQFYVFKIMISIPSELLENDVSFENIYNYLVNTNDMFLGATPTED